MLMDLDVSNDALDLEVAVIKDGHAEEDEDEDKTEFTGFSVFGNKICLYGHDGLFMADITA